MNFGAIKGLVGAVAPSLASAMGSPLAGAAMSAIADKLGVKNEPKEIEKAIQNATPEQLVAIKEAELDFEAKMAQMDVDIFALETADVQDARKAHKGDWTPRVFGLVSLFGFIGYIFLVTVQPPDANSDTIVSLVLGYLGGLVSGISSFYFGASHAKDD